MCRDDLDQCLAEVLTSPLMCRRAVYRWRQMLRDGDLHKEGWAGADRTDSRLFAVEGVGLVGASLAG